MKRLIALMLIASCAGVAFAQDVLALKDGKRIQNVFVSGKTDAEVSYIQNEEFLSIARDSVEAIIHENGSVEIVSLDLNQDSQFAATIDSMGLDINYVKQQLDRGFTLQNISWALWLDESYPEKCRKAGEKAYIRAVGLFALERQKEYRKAGLKNLEAQKQAYADAYVSKFPIKAANEAVRECAGEL